MKHRISLSEKNFFLIKGKITWSWLAETLSLAQKLNFVVSKTKR